LIPDGFVTAEKGINRIKILNKKGEFVEFVNSHNNFIKSVPLDLASVDGKTIYAAYPAESKLYVFNRITP
jgi:ABC-type nitrate/sulfonate/bicarbonate transport system substrate-binding protein